MAAQITLALGANTVIEQTQCAVAFSADTLIFGQQIGLLWLPLTDKRLAACSPAYLHEPKPWAQVDDTQQPSEWQLDLPTLFAQQEVQFLQLIAYVYQAQSSNVPATEMGNIRLSLNHDAIQYAFHAQERHVKAAIVLEIYQRNGVFKCRALAEGSTQGLTRLEQRVQVSLDTRPPHTHARIQQEQQHAQGQPAQRPPRQVQAGETWTGTAFAIDPYHLLTCQHVIESAAIIGIRQQGQPDREAHVVLSDVGSDCALIRVSTPLPSYLPLAQHGFDILGETITTLGFPLSGLSSQLQVTQGCISGLTGLSDDIRYLQFTAPIQPGSSGSPLLLPNGAVIGMVTASLNHEQAQNMNYAVKFQLLSALLTSAGITLADDNEGATHTHTPLSDTALSTPQLSKRSRSALWLVGCQG